MDFEATLNRWKPVGTVLLGLAALVDLVAVGMAAQMPDAVTNFGETPFRLLFLLLLAISALGIRALTRQDWATGSVCLAVSGIFHAPLLFGLVAMVASVRIWSAAERLWMRETRY